jgi:hypothetical protein
MHYFIYFISCSYNNTVRSSNYIAPNGRIFLSCLLFLLLQLGAQGIRCSFHFSFLILDSQYDSLDMDQPITSHYLHRMTQTQIECRKTSMP